MLFRSLIDDAIYKSFYGRATTSGNRHGQLYKSTDDGETWTFVRNCPDAGIGNYEENQMIRDPVTGLVIMTLRTDATKKVDVMYGINEKFWTTPHFGFDSYAKPCIAASANGTLLCLGRDATTTRPTFHWSNDLGKTWTTGFCTPRETFQTYGGVVWINGRFCAVWAEDESFPSGPCRIYRNFFDEI